MKKLLFVFAIISIVFVSCGNPAVGTWQLDSVSGEELTASEKEAIFTIFEDGTYEQKRGSRTKKGKWSLSEDDKTLTTIDENGKSESYSNFECDGGVLSFFERDNKISFKRVK